MLQRNQDGHGRHLPVLYGDQLELDFEGEVEDRLGLQLFQVGTGFARPTVLGDGWLDL